jgi:manganese/zinc/iron transport system permease protein
MAALIITPVSAARFWSDSIQKVYTISLIIGIISAFVGVGFSFYIANAPTGATIVLALTSVFFISAFFAPHKGIIARLYKQFNHKEKTQQENILKLCFHSIEHQDSLKLPLLTHSEIHNFEAIMNDQGIVHWKKHSKSLIKKGFLSYSAISDTWYITKEGLARGQRITRLHRLWEAYLLHHLQFDIDHVHEDADSIEHILTPELELALETILNNPKFDPHGETIPRIYIY